MSETPHWWVRNDSNSYFGPVTWDGLLEWVRDGRLGPESEISQDRQIWSRAALNPDLKMEWVAELPGGRFYGPIHHDAVQELLQNGGLPADTPLYTRSLLNSDREARFEKAAAMYAEKEGRWLTRLHDLDDKLGRISAALETAEHKQAATVNEYETIVRNLKSGFAERELKFSEQLEEQSTRLKEAENAQVSLRERLAREQSEAAVREEKLSRQVTDAEAVRDRAVKLQQETQAKLQEFEPEVYRLRHQNEVDQRRISQLEESVTQSRDEAQRLAALVSELQDQLQSAKTSFQARTVSESDIEVLEPEIVEAEPEPRASGGGDASGGGFGFRNGAGVSMAALEQQLQWELSQLGKNSRVSGDGQQ